MFISCDSVVFPAAVGLLAVHASERLSGVTVPPTKLARALTKSIRMAAAEDAGGFVGKLTV
jgi:hypothetical protein